MNQLAWFPNPHPKPKASIRLFCFPFAGAGTAVFYPWSKALPEWIEMRPVLLPGRESRLREEPITQISFLIEEMVAAIEPLCNLPCAFFGHSLGAVIAFELSCRLSKNSEKKPVHLFLSSRRAPHLPSRNPNLHELPDAIFIEQVQKRYNGVPQQILSDPELLKLFLPAMRADFTILETTLHVEEPPGNIPITMFGGVDDPTVTFGELNAWKKYTTSTFTVLMLPGDHFYLLNQRSNILTIIEKELAQDMKIMAGEKYHGQ